MPPVAIVTDSAASIPPELLERLCIRWVPYYIHRGKEVLRDMVSIRCEAFYEWMKTATEIPQTASPGPGDYLTVYEALAGQGVREIVSVHVTSRGSGAYQAALAARDVLLERLPWLKIEVIDTLNVAMCQGWMVIEAARAAQAGRGIDDIVALLRRMIPAARMVVTADTLKYLLMGGRIGRAKHLLGSLLNLKPLIGMEEGVIVALGTARSRRHAYEAMTAMIERAAGPGGRVKIAYVHAAALDEAAKLRALVEARLTCVESFFAELSPALGVHSGPGTVGVCYYPADAVEG